MPKEKIVDKTELIAPDNQILFQDFNNAHAAFAANAIQFITNILPDRL